MNRKIVVTLTFSLIVGITFFGLVAASDPTRAIHAEITLTKSVFRLGEELPWTYIYVVNPTWHTVDVECSSRRICLWSFPTLTPPHTRLETRAMGYDGSTL